MYKYIGRVIVGVMLVLGFTSNNFNINSKTTKNRVYYDNFEYTDNVVLSKKGDVDIDYNANLENVGDYYEISFDIINTSGSDMIISDFYYPKDDKYLDYSFTYNNGKELNYGDVLEKGKKLRVVFRVDYVNIVLDEDYEFDSSFGINYEQKI